MIPQACTTVLTLASSTPLSRALSIRNAPCHVRAAHVRISQECAPCHCLSAAHSCHVRAAEIMSPSGDPRHEGPHRYSGIAVTRAARSLLRALDGLAHAEHTIVMTNLMGVRWKLSSHQRSPGCILVLCNTWTDQSTNTGGCRFKLPGAVSTRFKTRCLNFLRIFPANVIQTHTTFYSLVCCY